MEERAFEDLGARSAARNSSEVRLLARTAASCSRAAADFVELEAHERLDERALPGGLGADHHDRGHFKRLAVGVRERVEAVVGFVPVFAMCACLGVPSRPSRARSPASRVVVEPFDV